MPMEGLTVGRMVHFVNADDTHCAAIVTHVFDAEEGIVNLCVLPGYVGARGVVAMSPEVVTYAQHADEAMSGFWHWIERA